MPLDLLFSCWFFYLFWKGQLVLSAAWGWDITPEFPYIREQGIGAYLGTGLFLLFARHGVVRQVLVRLRSGEASQAAEAIPPRTAVWGLLAGITGLVVFLMVFGMRFSVALVAIALYLIIALVITRIRAEFGAPVHDQHFSGPDHILTRLTGMQGYTGRELAMINFFYWFNRAYRSHPMPFALEGLKMAQATRVPLPTFVVWMLWAGLWGALLAF